MSQLAVFGGAKAVSRKCPAWPVVEETEKKAVAELMENGKWWMGEKVAEFERRYAAHHDAAFGVACCNGTVAIEMALVACGIGAGDEVIVPPYTFIASATAVLTANAVPVFADVEPDSFNLDPDAVEAVITERTRAILPVHFGGRPCDLDRILDLARRYGLRVIEDAAHSWGTQWKGKGAGSWSDGGTFSFQMSKNMTSGEGGILITNSEEVADKAWSYHHIGRVKGGQWYEHPLLGTNYRMTELQAAILLCQLDRLDRDVARREENAALLTRRIKDLPGFRCLNRDPRVTRRSWHMFDFFFVPEAWEGASRAQVLAALQAEGVPCSPGYGRPLYQHDFFRHIAAGKAGCPFTCPYRHAAPPAYDQLQLPNAEQVTQRCVWLPQNLLLGTEDLIGQVADALEKVWSARSELRRIE